MGECALAAARRIVEEQGHEAEPVFLVLAGGHVSIMPTPWNCEEDKVIMLAMVRNYLRESSAQAYVQVSEAWSVDVADMVDDAPPLNQPTRQEILLVTGQSRDGERFMWTMPIITEEGKRRLGDITRTTEADGRMFNLL